MGLTEYDVQKWLSFLLGGVREVVIPNIGRADIIIHDDPDIYIIEVKQASFFLSAIGQVIGYHNELEEKYRNKNVHRVVALYDFKKLSRERIEGCDKICAKNDIRVWWLDETFLEFMYDLEHAKVRGGRDIRPFEHFVEQFRFRRQEEKRVVDDSFVQRILDRL